MLADALKCRIAAACVTVGAGDALGRGVLVGGQLILTAAHNIILTFPLCCFDHIACWFPRNTP